MLSAILCRCKCNCYSSCPGPLHSAAVSLSILSLLHHSWFPVLRFVEPKLSLLIPSTLRPFCLLLISLVWEACTGLWMGGFYLTFLFLFLLLDTCIQPFFSILLQVQIDAIGTGPSTWLHHCVYVIYLPIHGIYSMDVDEMVHFPSFPRWVAGTMLLLLNTLNSFSTISSIGKPSKRSI